MTASGACGLPGENMVVPIEAGTESVQISVQVTWALIVAALIGWAPGYYGVILVSVANMAVKAAGKQTAFMVNMIVLLANHLTWDQTYSTEDFGAEFLEKYGWTELIGLRGPVASNRVACGFLLLGPQLEYPSHFHEAEEVYVPLTGQTLWQRSEQSWVYRTPGLPIYHASLVPHAIRTEAIPLLALYLWRGGNLVQKSMFAASRAAFPPHPAHG